MQVLTTGVAMGPTLTPHWPTPPGSPPLMGRPNVGDERRPHGQPYWSIARGVGPHERAASSTAPVQSLFGDRHMRCALVHGIVHKRSSAPFMGFH